MQYSPICGLVSAFALAAVSAFSAESGSPDLADILARISTLEQRVDQLTEENRQLREQLQVAAQPPAAPAAPAPSSAAPPPAAVVVKPAGKESSLKLGGFVHVNGEAGGTPDSRWSGINDRFLIRRARLSVAGTFEEDFSFKIEGDFGNNSISSRTSYTAQLTDGYLSWTPSEAASLRFGQFKTPFGYEQLMSDTKNPMVERSLPNDRLTISRQIGVGLYGDMIPKRLSYSVGVFNGNGVNNGNNDNDDFAYVGRVNGVLLQLDGLNLASGINAFSTRNTGSFTGRRAGFGMDVQLQVGDGTVWAEWLRNDYDPQSGTSYTAEGWSLFGMWTFVDRWQAVARYETYDSNTGLPETTNRTWTIGGTYLLKGDNIKFTLNYLRGKLDGGTRDDRFLGRLQLMY